MNFCHKQHYGRDLFYPENQKAKKFVEAFPHSSGNRKSLTLHQMYIMKEMGVPFVIIEILNKTTQGENNVGSRNERL